MITGGTVSFEDGVKAAAEYTPAKKAKVELSFDVADGADAEAVLDYVQKVAMSRVYDMLSSTGTADPAAKPEKPARAPRKSPTIAEAADAAAASVVKSSSVIAKSDKEKLAEQAGLVAKAASAAPANDPAAMDDFTVQPVQADPAAMDDLGTVAAEPVSDADLNKAMQVKNAEINNPVAIKKVLAAFNPDPSKQFTVAQIPQEARRTFLAKIAELKAA